MIFCGIDTSLSASGFCKIEQDTVEFCTIKTKLEGFSNDLDRFKYISDSIISKIPKDTNMIVIEDVFIPVSKAHMGAAIKLAMLAGYVRMMLYKTKIPFSIVAPTSIKKYLTGSGNAPKDQMAVHLFKNFNIITKNNNECDAVAMAFLAKDLYAMNNKNKDKQFLMKLKLNKPQIETITKILDERIQYNFDSEALPSG
jgi:crossover junction endodeoxyribonuclease RuvC